VATSSTHSPSRRKVVRRAPVTAPFMGGARESVWMDMPRILAGGWRAAAPYRCTSVKLGRHKPGCFGLEPRGRRVHNAAAQQGTPRKWVLGDNPQRRATDTDRETPCSAHF